MSITQEADIRREGETAVVYANEYLNKITGEKIERECRDKIAAGCSRLLVSFRDTEIVNSIGISILLGVIDAASGANAEVVFTDVNPDTAHLFETLGLSRHARIVTA
ncbi:MAG: STAS domain-containing protein [Aridibacter famidurans]|nr:STAS domain-containing protein [Aridibacter famidurans]